MATGFIPAAKRRTQLPRRSIHCGSSRWRGPCMWTSAPAHPSGEDHCLRENCSCQGARVAGRISRTARCGCGLAPSLFHLCELPHGAAAVRKRASRMLLRALTVGFVGSRFQAGLQHVGNWNTRLRIETQSTERSRDEINHASRTSPSSVRRDACGEKTRRDEETRRAPV